jgi:hypothetical protein
MVSAVNEAEDQSSQDQQVMDQNSSADATAMESEDQIVSVLKLPSPSSENQMPLKVSSFVVYSEEDHPDNAGKDDVKIASSSLEKIVTICSESNDAKSIVPTHSCAQSSETQPNQSSIANSSDESVRHFSKELMDLKSPYLSRTNSPAPVGVETHIQSPAVNKDGHSESGQSPLLSPSPVQEPLNGSMEFSVCSDKGDDCVGDVQNEESLPKTRSREEIPKKLGAGDGPRQDSDMHWKLEVLEMVPAPENVQCIEFSFEGDHSKSTDGVLSSTSDAAFTKPQTVGLHAKPRRVPLTTLSNVASPATPAVDGHSVGHFGTSPVPSPFLQSPFSPQTPMRPHTPSYALLSPKQSAFETFARHSSANSYPETPCTPSQGCTSVSSPIQEASSSKILAVSPAPSLYARQSDSPRPTQPCSNPLTASQIQTRHARCSITALPSPFMCQPFSPCTPLMNPPASPMVNDGHPQFAFIPSTESNQPYPEHSQSTEDAALYLPANKGEIECSADFGCSADPSELLSMTAEFSPSKPLTTSSPATSVRTKQVASNVPIIVNMTPDKNDAGIKSINSLASPNVSRTAQCVMNSRMTPDKIAAASDKILNAQSATPDKQMPRTPDKGNYVTPNKGPPSVGSCQTTHSPYTALRKTPVQTTDDNYSQHQNLAVASIMLTPEKGSKQTMDNDDDISNESDETVMSVATVVKEEQRLAIDAILQLSPAKSTCATPRKLYFRSDGMPAKSNSHSPTPSPQNFNDIVSKEQPVVFKIPDSDKCSKSPLKNNENLSQTNVISNKDVDQSSSDLVESCDVENVPQTAQDLPPNSVNSSSGVLLEGKGSVQKKQTTGGKIIVESENSGNELNLSVHTASDVEAPIYDHQHSVMMESISSETISAFQAYAESIPGVDKSVVSAETTQINVNTNFGLLPQNQSVVASTASLSLSSSQITSAQVATSCSQEVTSAFAPENTDNETELLAEIHDTLASMPVISNDQNVDSMTPSTLNSHNDDIPLSAGALMGFSAAQEQMYSTPASQSNTVFTKSPKYQQSGTKKKKKSRAKSSSASEIGTPPALSYPVPIPRAIDLQDPGVRVLQVITQKGKVIPIFLTPLDVDNDQSKVGEPGISSEQGRASSSPLKVIPVEAKEIASSEARLLLQDHSQSFDTIFNQADASGKTSFIDQLLSCQTDNTSAAPPNEKTDTSAVQVSQTEAAVAGSRRLVNTGGGQVSSECGSSANTSPDMAQSNGTGLYREGIVMKGTLEIGGNKRKKKSEENGKRAKKQCIKSAPVDDCDNVELLDFLQAHPVGDLCRKTMPSSPYKSPANTPAKVESYKFCSPAPAGDNTQDGNSTMWHDIVNIDLGEQTKIMADITRPLSELVKTPTKSRAGHIHAAPTRGRHAVAPSRLNNDSNSSVNFSPSQGKLRPILESCSIIDNHVIASPSMSLDPEPMGGAGPCVDPDIFLQTLPESVTTASRTLSNQVNVMATEPTGHLSDVQSCLQVPPLSAMTPGVTTRSKVNAKEKLCVSPLEIAAAESGIFPNEDLPMIHQQSLGNSQVLHSSVATPSAQMALVDVSANSQSSSVQIAAMNIPVNPSTCSMNLPSIEPLPPVQSNVVLIQLPNGQYAVLQTSNLLQNIVAPTAVTPAPSEFVRTKRRYKQRKKKTPNTCKSLSTPENAVVHIGGATFDVIEIMRKTHDL